jgi:hypothetical protein
MHFQSVPPGGEYGTMRMMSELGLWEFGLDLRSSGLRLRMGKTGKPPKVLDFCMGRDPALYSSVVLAVLQRLETLPESYGENEIDALFPWAGTRPDLALHLSALLEAPAGPPSC